ncbi:MULTISPECIES: hypothetical protein [unclassified Nonomuraea]|uniref:hypothetical protein n=1 Tax=Nonomuraea sp. NPDC047529 TaxID=3155623 RepID=UPI0033F2FA58
MNDRSARALSRALVAAAVAGAAVMAPGVTGTGGAWAAADPTCGSWVSSLVFPGLSARACIWGTGASWKQAQTEVFNGTGFAVEVEVLTATLDPLPGNARCTAIRLQNGQTAFCGTRGVPDNNPFQFDRAVGSTQVTDLVHREQFAFASPFVG